jgi:hypothetical protein
MVSIWMPGVMYIIEPASATALSPGSSSTSTNCISLPRTRKSISWALRPAIGGGGAARRVALPPERKAASSGTSVSGVQFFIPAVNTSVLPSIVPFRRFVITSSCETGPT